MFSQKKSFAGAGKLDCVQELSGHSDALQALRAVGVGPKNDGTRLACGQGCKLLITQINAGNYHDYY
jgi:hypothetical protein